VSILQHAKYTDINLRYEVYCPPKISSLQASWVTEIYEACPESKDTKVLIMYLLTYLLHGAESFLRS
jgi:hypothetical protein